MERENFGSRLGFILVSAGCAVGLGNVWKFPYICGQNGGAAFILIYLACLTLLGLPILVCEYAIGRGSGRSIIGAFDKLESKGSNWHSFKWFGFAGNYLLMMFYTMVAGWMLYYTYLMATGRFVGMDATGIQTSFSDMLASPGILILFTMIVIVASFGVCAKGLRNGVEKVTKIMMILLIVLMLILAVRSVTLSGASEGLKFYLVPDFNKLMENGIGNVVFAAMTHAFFTLSVGMGSMEIFGSYLSKDKKLTGEALSVALIDTFVAIMAGIIIIPSCFAYGVEPGAGPSLLFITLPNVFNHMPGGRIWGTCFFIFMSFAAFSTVIAVFENIVSMMKEGKNWTTQKSVLVNLVGVSLLSLPAILGFNLLAGIQPMGAGTSLMDLEDFLVSYNILPLGSLLFVLFCTRKNGWGWDGFMKEANTGSGMNFPNGLRGYMTYVVPLIIVAIYLKGYYDTFVVQGTAMLITWMGIACLLLAGVFYLAFGGKKEAESPVLQEAEQDGE